MTRLDTISIEDDLQDVVLKSYYKRKLKISIISKNMTWDEFKITFDWLPFDLVEQLVDFNNTHRRNPYQHFNDYNTPLNIDNFTYHITESDGERVSGLFIHMWNNMGRLVKFDTYRVVAFDWNGDLF